MTAFRPFDLEALPQKVELHAVSDSESKGRRGRYVLARRRDRRLWGGLSPVQVRAAQYIVRGYEGYVVGLGARTVRLSERMDSGIVDDSWLLDFVADYNRWIDACRNDGVGYRAVVDVLVFGESLRRVERANRRRNGWARQNLVDGLRVFCDLKGWR